MKLHQRYALVIGALLLLVAIALSALHDRQQRGTIDRITDVGQTRFAQAMQRTLREHAASVARLLANGLTTPVYEYDVERVYEILRDARRQAGIEYVLVFDDQQLILHDGHESIPRFGQPMRGAMAERAVRARETLVQEDGEIIEAVTPIHAGAQYLGGVRVGFSREVLTRNLNAMQADFAKAAAAGRHSELVRIGYATLGIMAVAAAMGLLVARQLSRPIRALATAASHIGTATGDVPVPVVRNDELGALAEALRRMQVDLRERTVSRAQLAHILDSMHEAVLVLDADYRVVSHNRPARTLLHGGEQDLQGLPIAACLTESLPPRVTTRGADRPPVQIEETVLRRLDGSVVAVGMSLAPLLDEPLGEWVCVLQDLTERLEGRRRRQLAAGLFEHSIEGIALLDETGRIVQVNAAFSELTGRNAAAIEGRRFSELVDRDHRSTATRLVHRVRRRDRWEGELHYLGTDGGPHPARVAAAAIRDRDGDLEQVAVVITDLSQQRRAERTIHHLAYYDPLTGLPNRALFRNRLEEALATAARDEHALALLFLDLDRFKIINDTRGHACGDELLTAVAHRLQSALEAGDCIARLGGDEFAVLLPALASADEAQQVAIGLIHAFAQPFDTSDGELFTSTSIGISVYPRDGREAESLLRNADAAMYRAKEQGRNTYFLFTQELNARLREYGELEHELREALHTGALELHYQPQVSLVTGDIVGAEALMRWHHPVRGWVPPGKFIPIAEDSGLIGELSEWALAEAVREQQRWESAGLTGLRLAVNLSARQFRDPNLIQQIEQALTASGTSRPRLELEITETFLMDDIDHTVQLLLKLKELGVRVSVDDFGTGYSSLAYLKRFPIHTLKIDRTFIRDIQEDSDDAAIVLAILSMAHALGVAVVAEGVERAEQADYLSSHGCQYAQGFLYAPALPGETFLARYGPRNGPMERASAGDHER
ncbi:EAL domain-containing protein [Arhodomonas sp. AD133]|uniref:bifunctional diguanylate cyclase/phosphodiesterase n=1 Tax=Arhodomonas sp. AD133 TaxID=3415009 RepID=UPI003EBAFD61